MKSVKHLNAAVLVGIVVLRSAAMARFMNKNVAGIHVPDSLVEEMDKAEKKAAKGIEIAARLIKEMRDMCQGVHIMAIGMEDRVPAILDAAGM
jgi:5,10-methylenetetrahydrofolate reductase